MNAEEKFKTASERHQQAIIKHVEEYSESSEEEELAGDTILKAVFQQYDTNLKESIEKVTATLEDSFRSGGAICLVCISSIKRPHAIWCCKNCHSAFHLNCINQWAKDSMRETKIWNCPKCRHDYPDSEIPDVYKCFCGKSVNPEYDPWLVPHSCGKQCGKYLTNNCEHTCVLLCHPGPCPPCPQSVLVKCNCGQNGPKTIRCSVGKWCCGSTCNKLLSCGIHKCQQPCHNGECNECQETNFRPCRCKASSIFILCKDSSWQCDKICGKPLLCGFHKCPDKCHDLECRQCSLSGLQNCPCGSVAMNVNCPDEVPSCGGTCNRPLECGAHYCPNKCHKNPCLKCIEIIDKKCRCGTHTKMLPCSKEFLCQTKCKNMKLCGIHACNKKCCDGNCSSCTKICGKVLRCGKHKCELVCHLGPCYPCGITAKIACRCGHTVKKVPCGSEKKTKAPTCNRVCRLPRLCTHPHDMVNKHSCHFGSCPKCKEKCMKTLDCGHICEEFCHNAVPVVIKSPKPALPWENQPEKVELKLLKCPPCKHFKPRPCIGGHESPMMRCTTDPLSSCGKPCGRPLKCGRHICMKLCHAILNEDPVTKSSAECETCERQCDIPSPEGCKHRCPKTCHAPPCNPCAVFLKHPCHCGIMELFVQCSAVFTTNKSLSNESLSCNQQCSKMLSCSHRCGKICHPGECLSVEDCVKKVAVFCECKRLKKMANCNKIAATQVKCDDTCKSIIIEKLKQQEELELQMKKEEDERNKREIAEYERKFGTEKRIRKRKKSYTVETKTWKIYIVPITATILILGIIIAVYVNNS